MAKGGCAMETDRIVLAIDQSHMWVALAIKKPEGEEPECLTVDFILGYLKENGIKAGINRAAIEALVSYVEYDKEVVVASGKPAVNGRDGIYKYLIPLEDQKDKPVVGADGSVDYLNSLKLAMVEEGQTFALYEPPTKGEYGYTVFSEMLKPVPGRPLPLLKGKGFTVSEDGLSYSAKLSGRIYTENDRIIIEPIYVVKGDLGIEHGNISFNGDVEIHGDVHSGLRIEAKGCIFVNGHVGNCKLHAGGNITIGKGVQGKYGCEITAGGDVAASFVERCNITSGGTVYADSLMDCRVFARNAVFVTSRHGCIIGGSVNAMQSITAKEVGNPAGIITKLQFGEMQAYRKEFNGYKNRLQKVREDIGIFEAQLEKYEQIDGSRMSKDMEQIKMQIVRAKVIRQAEQRSLEEQVSQMEQEFRSARMNSFVRVTGVVHPGSMIMTESAAYVQTEAYKDIYYRQWLGQIQLLSPEEYENQIVIAPDMENDKKSDKNDKTE